MATAAPSLGALGEALIAIHADLAGLRDDVKNAKKIVKDGVDDIQKSTETMGKALSAGLTAPIVAIGASAVLVGKKVDEALDDIRASTGATGAKLESLGQTFKSIFKSVPNDAKDVADAIVVLNQRLGTTGPALEETATQILNLSRVGKAELKPLVDDTTKLFAAWQVATEDQAATLDTLFKASQQTGVGVGALIQGVTQAGPVFRQLGFDLTTSAALLGQWQKNGIDAEAALNGLRIASMKFAKDGQDAQSGLKAIVEKMLALGPGAAASKLAVETFGRGAVAMTDAVFKGAFSVDQLVASVRNSQETINKAAFDTLSFADKWKVFQHNVEAALEPLGTKLLDVFQDALPTLERGVDMVAGLVEKFRALPSPVQDGVLALGGLLAVIGPGTLVAVKFVEQFVKLREALVALQEVQIAGGVLGWIGSGGGIAGLAAGPQAPLVLGVLALAGAFLVLKHNLDQLENRGPSKAGQPIPGVSDDKRITLEQARSAAKAAGDLSTGFTATFGKIAGSARATYDPMSDFLQQLQAARAQIDGLSASQRAHATAALIAGADQKKVQDALNLNDLAMGLFGKTVDDVKKKQEALKKANEEYASSAAGSADTLTFYTNVLDRLGNATYEGIAFDHARGISTAALAATYGVTELQVNQVIKSEENFKQQLDETTKSIEDSRKTGEEAGKALTASFAGMPDVLKSMAAATARFDATTGGLVSGSLLASHAIANVNGQGALIGETFYQTQLVIDHAMTAAARSFLPLTDEQKRAIDQMHKLGMTAEEIAAQLGLSARQVGHEIGFTREQFHSMLDELAGSLTQLAQVSDGTFGGITKDLAQLVVSWNAAAKAATQYQNASSMGEKFAALGAGVTAVAGATQGGGAKGIIGGALSGAELGEAVAGPIGAAVGAIGGALVGLFRTDHTLEDIARDAGQKFGTKFSQATTDAIKTDIKTKGMSEVAAEINNLDKIIADAGGLTAENIGKLTDRLRDTFVMVGRGELTAAQGAAVLDKNFGAFVTAATSGVGVLNARIVELVKLNRAAGTGSAEIAKFVSGQIGSNVFGGLQAGLTNSTLASQAAASAAAGAVLSGIGELQRQGVDFVTALTQARPAVEALQTQLAKTGFDGGEAFAQIASYVDLAKDEIAGPALQAAAGFGQALVGLNNSGLLTQDIFEGLTSQIAATRENLVKQGKDGGAVLRLLAPQLQQIWEIQQQTGLAVDATTQSLLSEAEAQGIVGEKFKGPQQQIADALDRTNEILTAIGKTLGADIPAAAERGARGVTNALNTIPGRKNVDVVYTYSTEGEPPPMAGGDTGDADRNAYAFAGGRVISTGVQYFNTSGIVKPDVQYFARSGIVGMRPRGQDTVPIMASPGELLLNLAHQGNIAGAIQTAVNAAASAGQGQPIELTLHDTINIGGETIGTITRKLVWPELRQMFRVNANGSRTDARQVLGVS